MRHYSDEKNYEKKQQNKQNKNFTAETQYLNLKAPTNDDKTAIR